MAAPHHTKPGSGRRRAQKDDALEDGTPTSPQRVRVKLDTITAVTKELGRLYREARVGKVEVAEATKLAYILSLMGRMIEGSDLERRLDEIEARQNKEQSTWDSRKQH